MVRVRDGRERWAACSRPRGPAGRWRGTGDLYRVPKEALIQGGSPVIHKESLGASRLVRISKNPFITTLQARLMACEHNIEPNF